MIIKDGVDLVYLPRFKKSLKRGGEKFLQRVFTERELIHLRGGVAPQSNAAGTFDVPPVAHLEGETAHLAGIFAAKEAIIKALSLPNDSWHDIYIIYKQNGQPQAEIINHKSLITNHSLSISHDGNYTIAQFVAILKK